MQVNTPMSDRIGILLAGGNGTRLYPTTDIVNKHLLPIYNKPMIYYSLSLFLSVGIKEIIVISKPDDMTKFADLFKNISKFGVRFHHIPQYSPCGIPDAFIISKKLIYNKNVMLVLGDNIIYGSGLQGYLSKADNNTGATIFGYQVKDPRRFGVVEIADDKIISLEEKPENPKSDLAIPGVYFYDDRVCNFTSRLRPSSRGELEITDLNKMYMEYGSLNFIKMGRGVAYFDAGTYESMITASNFVYSVESNQGYMIACLEELALRSGYVDQEMFNIITNENYGNQTEYERYVRSLVV